MASIGSAEQRAGHAILDLQSRNAKARKIERLLDLKDIGRPLRLLEVGTGSGGIAHYFGSRASPKFDVDAVDVEDVRQVCGGYRFTLLENSLLPFHDSTFDIVITNHVLEHVGDQSAQRLHLREIRRVLKPDGVGYLAVPNRWQLVEPHYRLAFLSWLPPEWRSPYVRMRNRGDCYDCRPPTVPELESLLGDAGFEFVQLHGSALKVTYEIERPDAFIYQCFHRWAPTRLYAMLRKVFPTLIYVLRRSSASGMTRPA